MAAEEDPWQTELQALRAQQEALAARVAALEQRTVSPPRRTLPFQQARPLPRLNEAGLEQLIGIQGLSWLGILALVTGLGLFIRYAFLEGWLGPVAILAGGAVASAALLATGEWLSRRETYRTWAHALMGGGIAVLYFLVYAAYHFPYFRQVTHLNQLADALLLMAVVALAIGLALRRRSQSLASRAFLLGFLTSLLSQELSELTLIYNLILSVGLVGVAAICRWQLLGLLGIVGSYVLHAFWMLDNPEAVLLAQGLLLIYTGLYAAVSVRVPPHAQFWQSGPAIYACNLLGFAGLSLWLQDKLEVTVFLIALALWLLVAGVQQALLQRRQQLTPIWQKLLWGHALLALGLGEYALREAQADRSLYWLAWTVLALGWSLWARQQGAFTLERLSYWLTAEALAVLLALKAPPFARESLWALESLLLLALAGRRPALAGISLSLTLLLSLSWHGTLESAYATPPALNVWLWHLTALLVLLVQATWAHRLPMGWLPRGLAWSAGLCVTLWLAAALPAEYISLSWTLAGFLLVSVGFLGKHMLLRQIGLALLLLAGAKVGLYDLRDLAMGWRIGSLLVLGGLMLGVALFYTRHLSQSKGPDVGNDGA
ncbi:MAG: DUF2339 domain-containing protein [Candidatus Sericytochromatia bacterium]